MGLLGATACGGAQSPCFMMESRYTVAIRQGPDAGMSFQGVFGLRIAEDGHLYGAFKPDSGLPPDKAMPITGSADGQAVSLRFTVAPGVYIYGTGTADHDLFSCHDPSVKTIAMGGVFSGPQPGDLGDWQCSTHGYVRAGDSLTGVFNGTTTTDTSGTIAF